MTALPVTELEMAPLALDPDGARVVAIGGGHGLSACLQAVQSYASHITAVVTVADDGGSSGRLVSNLGIPPPGDIRRCLLALTPEPSMWYELFSYRFEGGEEEPDVMGHSLGNLIIAALSDLSGDFARGVRWAGEMLGALGTVVPAARQALRLSAIVDGRQVDGQVEVQHAAGRIERLLLGPKGITARPEAVEAIEAADQIVLGPGSLFTSVLAAMCVPGIAAAIDRSQGSLVFVLNLVTQDAETLGMTGMEHLEALHTHGRIGRTGTIAAHRGPMDVPEGHDAVEIDPAIAGAKGWKVHHADMVDRHADWPAHDPVKLGRALAALV